MVLLSVQGSIQLVLDSKTNVIPFEILNDGKDFLSDYIIFSRVLVNAKEYSNEKFSIDSNNDFSIVANPSEDEDIKKNIEEEFDVSITIADERAMSQKHSPFRTVGILADYIEMLLVEKKND